MFKRFEMKLWYAMQESFKSIKSMNVVKTRIIFVFFFRKKINKYSNNFIHLVSFIKKVQSLIILERVVRPSIFFFEVRKLRF